MQPQKYPATNTEEKDKSNRFTLEYICLRWEYYINLLGLYKIGSNLVY